MPSENKDQQERKNAKERTDDITAEIARMTISSSDTPGQVLTQLRRLEKYVAEAIAEEINLMESIDEED